MRSGNLHGVNLAVVRVNPKEKCVLGPDQYVKHIDLEAVCLEKANYSGSLLLGGQNKSELLLRGEQEDLIRSGGQASGILLWPLVVAISGRFRRKNAEGAGGLAGILGAGIAYWKNLNRSQGIRKSKSE